MEFEYDIKKFHIEAYGVNQIKEELNKLGLFGWEVCGVTFITNCFLVYTIKRVINK